MSVRIFLFLCLLTSLGIAQQPHTVLIGPGYASSLADAARNARPGDTLRYLPGIHAGGAFVSGLQGTFAAPIVITGASDGTSVIEGGNNAFQLSDPAHLIIQDLVIRNQTGNGMNLDDGGTYDTPATKIHIQRCRWEGIAATGNNDLLKLSGVNLLDIEDCTFHNGAAGGSMIDMVGCHDVRIERNFFSHAGSNCIQVKGGCISVLIQHNHFLDGGARALNIGGSTGRDFFRPLNVTFEARYVHVFANFFRGGEAAMAFVTADSCCVSHNTILYPTKWVFRILQETNDPWFVSCGSHRFFSNLVVVDQRTANPSVNIGPGTRPETFLFTSNLWYHSSNPQWSGPNLPSAEEFGILGRDPLLQDPARDDGALLPTSPAIGAAHEDGPCRPSVFCGYPPRATDLSGRPYPATSPWTIGAMEAGESTAFVSPGSPRTPTVDVYPHPLVTGSRLRVTGLDHGQVDWFVYALDGRLCHSGRQEIGADGEVRDVLEGRDLLPGLHVLVLRTPMGQMVSRVLLK